ncbi:hypothetical protein LshimejAT787_1702220 [Lyophyllum shimeji]|uniref:Uncharacterized protein n=1 Tax=Lyophyllum shimeji TaxID=47721 RepID=A0A9P3PX19_LYOSH|nr:hypothetical protein LshimejAT787_1702220 [Lyophyllum shimeji]
MSSWAFADSVMRDQSNMGSSQGSGNDSDTNNVPQGSTTFPSPGYPPPAFLHYSSDSLPSYYEREPPRYTLLAFPNPQARTYGWLARVTWRQVGVGNFPGVTLPMVALAPPEQDRSLLAAVFLCTAVTTSNSLGGGGWRQEQLIVPTPIPRGSVDIPRSAFSSSSFVVLEGPT